MKIKCFIKTNPFFCNLTGKVIIIYNHYLYCFKSDNAFSTNIDLVIYTYKTPQNILVFCLKNPTF